MQRAALLGLVATLSLTGCDADKLKDALSADITGSIKVSGDMPAGFTFKLYSVTDNLDAFDTSYCEGNNADCWGRVKVNQLNTKSDIGEIKVTGSDFQLLDVPADLGFILVVGGDDPEITCTTDIVGFDEATKVVNKDSAITLGLEGGLNELQLPRKVQLNCFAPATEPEPVEEPVEPEPEPIEELVEDDGDIKGPETVEAWTSFIATGKAGSPTYADASAGDTLGDAPCGADFPAVVEVAGTIDNPTSDEAYIRIQFGTGDEATYRTIATPIVDGQVNQAISLTGGYSIVQLDTTDELEGEGESHTISFCEKGDPPAQEMLVILSWDKDDTDVDMHLYSDASEVAYYSMSQGWGDLDIDDIDGFGPETFASNADTSGNIYEVKVHYYSDHGNGDTEVTARVVYYDATTDSVCDVNATAVMSSYGWWDVGVFGPGMDCPAQ
jgi:hypothetical protein